MTLQYGPMDYTILRRVYLNRKLILSCIDICCFHYTMSENDPNIVILGLTLRVESDILKIILNSEGVTALNGFIIVNTAQAR